MNCADDNALHPASADVFSESYADPYLALLCYAAIFNS